MSEFSDAFPKNMMDDRAVFNAIYPAATRFADGIVQFHAALDQFRLKINAVGSLLNQHVLLSQQSNSDTLDIAIDLRDHVVWEFAGIEWINYELGNTYKTWLCQAFRLSETEFDAIIAQKQEEARNKKAQELASMPYSDYLRTPEWQARRGRILERDGYRCQICYSSQRLNVHHRTYARRGDESDSDLVTLCQPCHQTFHETGRLARVRE